MQFTLGQEVVANKQIINDGRILAEQGDLLIVDEMESDRFAAWVYVTNHRTGKYFSTNPLNISTR